MTTPATDRAPEHRDGDLLEWLGFSPGPEDAPLVHWPRPTQRPSLRRSRRGRHRALGPGAA